MTDQPAETAPTRNFIRGIIDKDLEAGKHTTVVTRFPPEPNGYLHIGHAKSICLNFGLARDYRGRCHLRFDDTNPAKEDVEYVNSIKEDVKWLGFDWGEHLYYASDYFEKFYEHAVQLIKQGKAYVCELTADQMTQYRGTLTEPGRPSPWRDRPVAESLDLFERMRKGEFPDGAKTLRAKIDMASPNVNLRDPVMYRIKRHTHVRTGDAWCIYPMYDNSHCVSDSIEGITHSICTLEFEAHRPLYDWYLDQVDARSHAQQIEFARLNLNYTVMSKRLLLELVKDGHVSGWDDPRMPTIAGFRRRGYTPEAIRNFCDSIGVAKGDSIVDLGMLESAIRDDLNTKAPRVMGVLDPIKVVIDNYPEGQTEEFESPYCPDEPAKMGYRKVPFSRELWIERADFMETPAKKFWRLAPGREVRLRWAYLVTCTSVVKDPATGQVVEVHCTADLASRGGNAPDGRKVKGTIHWVSAPTAVSAEVRLYDRLFSDPNPAGHKGKDFKEFMNKGSLVVVPDAKVEPSLGSVAPGSRVQFERTGYFCADAKDSTAGRPVFNRIVTLKDTWARLQAQGDVGE